MSTYNLNEQVFRSLHIMNYDRSKTLLEQPESVMDRRYNIKTIPKPKTKESNPCDGYQSPEFCKSKFGQESICPGSKNDFEWGKHCYYVLPDKSTFVGVNEDEKIKIVDGSFIRGIHQNLKNKNEDNIKKFIKSSDLKNINYLFDLYKTKLDKGDTEIVDFLISLFPLGTVYELTDSQNTVFNSKFKITKPNTSSYMTVGGVPKTENRPTKIEYYGLYNQSGDEYENDSADLRSGLDKFIDDWGVTIQLVGALGFAVASIFTGGASGVLAAEIIAELTIAGALAYRAYESEKGGFAVGMEMLFGALPLLKTSKNLVGISDDVIGSIATKWNNARFSKEITEKEFVSFWIKLTDEEAKAFKQILTQEDWILAQLAKLVNSERKLMRSAFEVAQKNNESIKNIALKFWKSSAGQELKLTGLLMLVDIAMQVFGNTTDKQLNTAIEEFLSQVKEENYSEVIEIVFDNDDFSEEGLSDKLDIIAKQYPNMKNAFSTLLNNTRNEK